MAKFIQKNQKVNNQVNAETITSVNFGSLENKGEFINELRKILVELNKRNDINEEILIAVENHIKTALVEAEKSEPQKEEIIKNIDGARSMLDGVASAASLITTLIKAAQIVGSLFI